MRKHILILIALCSLCGLPADVGAQVYRCGNEYTNAPAEGCVLVPGGKITVVPPKPYPNAGAKELTRSDEKTQLDTPPQSVRADLSSGAASEVADCFGEAATTRDGHKMGRRIIALLRGFMAAVDKGDANAQHCIATAYYWDIGVPQDHAEAFKWYQLAARQGLQRAQYNLGVMYRDGQGVARDYIAAIEWFRAAAGQGHAGAQNDLGAMYYYGQGVTRDNKESVKWLRLAAAQGDADGQYGLGNMYGEGAGVEQSHVEAVRWYQLAALQGHALAQHNLASSYARGQGVERSYPEAIRLHKLAAAQGLLISQYGLGAMYGNGQGVAQDFVRAHMWFNLGAVAGDKKALLARNDAATRMTPQQIAEAQKLARECQARKFKDCD